MSDLPRSGTLFVICSDVNLFCCRVVGFRVSFAKWVRRRFSHLMQVLWVPHSRMVSSHLRTSILGSRLSHLTVRGTPRQSSPHGIVSCTVREHVNANSRPTPAIPSEVRDGDSLQELDF